jgi:hypothetical protein
MKDENRTVDLHFFNASRPQSPFSKRNRRHTARDPLALLLEVRGIHPNAEQLRCGQYMDHEGSFHPNNAGSFGNNGQHPYACEVANCGFERAIDHLRDISAKPNLADA